MIQPKRQKPFTFTKLVALGILSSLLITPSGCVQSSINSEVSLYIQQLRDKSEQQRWNAAANLGRIGPAADSAIPKLMEALQDESALVRLSAANALGKIGIKAKSAVPKLLVTLKDKDEDVSKESALALSRIGSPAVDGLIAALKDNNVNVRLNAIVALGKIGGEAKAAVPVLIPLLQEQNLIVKEKAIESLGGIGQEAQAAIPNLISALKDKNWRIRASTAYALGEIRSQPKIVVPILINLFKDEDAVVRERSALALSKIGADAVPMLVASLNDENQIVRQGAVVTLGEIGLPATSALVEALKSNNQNVRQGTISALGIISKDIQYNSRKLSASRLEQAISIFQQASSSLEKQQFTVGIEPSDIEPIKLALNSLREEQGSRFSDSIIEAVFWIFLSSFSILFIVIWLRPVFFLRLSRAIVVARQENELFSQVLVSVQRFLLQAGATVKSEGKRGLRIISTTGRLKGFTPLPVLLAIDQPGDQDVTELVKYAIRMGGDRHKRAGILLYRVLPDTMFRVRMAEVRLSENFVLIPIPLAAVEQVVTDSSACAGLLAQYADRYLPGADLFDDRNAIGDTLSFFGRGELLHRLEEELLRKQGVGLFGLRKSGKTSILLQLSFALRQHPIVHIDLQPYGGQSRYSAELFNVIVRQLSLLIKENNMGKKLEFEPFKSGLPAAELTSEFMHRMNKLSEVLVQSDYKLPIILFLDEIERILPAPTDSSEKVEEFNACFGVWRSLSQEKRQLGLLIADVHPDSNRINQWQQEGVPTNPVFSFFKEVFLSPFTEEETTTMLTDISRLMGRSFDQQTLATIHNESGGHPFIARQIASLLCAKVPESSEGLITWSDAQRYINKPFTYSSILKDYFGQNIWADLQKRNFTSAMAILQVLACNQQLASGISNEDLKICLGKMFTESQYLDALLWLEKVGLVNRLEQEAQDLYTHKIPMLSRWLQMEMGEEEKKQWQIP